MKKFTEQKVDDMIKLRFGKLVTASEPEAFVTYALLAKLYKCTPSTIRRLILERFEKHRQKEMTLMERLQKG